MRNNFKSAMDQIKPDPEMLEQIIEKVERQESGGKNMFWKKNFVKYAVIAATITLLATGGVVVTMAAVNSGEETEVVEEPKILTQDEVKNMMINSIDYFESAQGEFTYTSVPAEYDYTVSYQVSNVEDNYASHVVTTNNIYGIVEESWYDGTNFAIVDHSGKTYSLNQQAPSTSETQTFESSIGITPEGDPITHQRPDPTNMGIASSSLFPQNYAFTHLEDNSTWSIIGYEEYLGRDVVVIEGTESTHYYVDTYKMWVDTETGIMLKYESYNEAGEVMDCLETTSITIDDPAINELDYSYVIPEGYVDINQNRYHYESQKQSSSNVFTFKPVEELGTKCISGQIFTTYTVQVIDTIQGEVSGNITLNIPGGSVTAEEFYNSLDPENAADQFPDGPTSVPEQYLVSIENHTVSVTIGEEYLATADYNEETGEYQIHHGAYGVYTVDGDQAVNEYTGEVVQSSDF